MLLLLLLLHHHRPPSTFSLFSFTPISSFPKPGIGFRFVFPFSFLCACVHVCVCVCVCVCVFFLGARKSRACLCCGEMVRRRRRTSRRRRSLWRNGKKEKEKKFVEFCVLTCVGCFVAGVRCSWGAAMRGITTSESACPSSRQPQQVSEYPASGGCLFACLWRSFRNCAFFSTKKIDHKPPFPLNYSHEFPPPKKKECLRVLGFEIEWGVVGASFFLCYRSFRSLL